MICIFANTTEGNTCCDDVSNVKLSTLEALICTLERFNGLNLIGDSASFLILPIERIIIVY